MKKVIKMRTKDMEEVSNENGEIRMVVNIVRDEKKHES